MEAPEHKEEASEKRVFSGELISKFTRKVTPGGSRFYKAFTRQTEGVPLVRVLPSALEKDCSGLITAGALTSKIGTLLQVLAGGLSAEMGFGLRGPYW